jgi:6-phosphogluconolactonase (cycloisomerase 2 family)
MKRLLMLAVAVGILLSPQFARAQSCDTTSTIYWTGNAKDNQWTTKGNWSTGALPGLSDNVCIDPSYSVTAASAGIDINSLNLLGTLTITNSAGMNLHSTSITSTLTNLTVGTNSGLFITGTAKFSGSVTLASGGTIAGNNSLNSGTATFTGAVMVTGNSALTVPTINNQGSIAITQASVQFTLGNGTFNNQAAGAVNIQADGVTINFTGTFNNAGTFAKTEGTGSSNIDMSGASVLVNTGTVVANSGTLILNLSPSTSGNTSTGAFNAAGGATLSFAGGNVTLNAGTTFGGSGTIDFTSGIWTVSAPITVTTANLILDGGTVMGSSTLTLDSKMTTWNSGLLELLGTDAKVTLSAGKTMLITSANNHGLFCELDIFGTVNQNTSIRGDDLTLNNATVYIEHGAKFNLQADGGIHGSGTISDLGTFAKTEGTPNGVSNVDYNGTFNMLPADVGTVAVIKGTLNFANSSGGTFTGTSTVESGATLQFNAGTYYVVDGTKFTGSGTTLISSVGSWSLQGVTDVDTGVFQLNGVTGSSLIQGTGNLTVNSKKFNFTGGEMTGTGTITIPVGVTLSISTGPTYILGGSIKNSGIAQITDSSKLYLGGGMTWTNVTAGSEFTFKANGSIDDGGGGVTFNNKGKVQKTGGELSSFITFVGTLNNNGSIDVATGTLYLQPSVGTSAAAFTAAKGATLAFSDTTGASQWAINTGTTMTGEGGILLLSTWNLAADLTVSSAAFGFDGSVIDVGGAFDLTLASPSITVESGLRRSVLQNGMPVGTVIIQKGSQVAVSSYGGLIIDACTMENFGATTINNLGSVTIQGSAVLVNEIGGTITLDKSVRDNTAAILVNAANGFTNAGTLTFGTDASANRTQTIGGTAPFTNRGQITIPFGRGLTSVNGYTEEGTTTLEAATLTTNGPFSIFGALEGTGSVGGAGSIEDIIGKIEAGVGGTAPDRLSSSASSTVGILNLSVPLTVDAGGTVIAALNGTKAGTQYDQIISTSSVALGGTLDLQFGNGFSPAPTNSFAILSFASSTGSFASVVTPSSTCTAKLTTTSTSLSVAFTSSSVGVTISPTTVPLVEGAQQQFTDTVTNGCGNGVTWKVKEGSSGGKITAKGLYTAAATAGTFHVIVTSVADPTQSATATVTVTAAAGKNLSVTPQAAVALPGGSVRFAASQSVTWSIAEGTTGGSVSATGTYTAALQPGLYHVIASSTADAATRAVVNIAVVKGTLKSAYVASLDQNSVSVLTANPRSAKTSGPATGLLTETQSLATGQSPAGLAISPQGLLLTANRNSNDVSAFAVSAADSSLQPVSGPAFDAGTAPSAVAWDPSGRLAFVTDADSDDISLFFTHQTSGQLSFLGKQALDAGDQPSAVVVDPSAPFVFVAGAGGNNVRGFTYDMAGMSKEMPGSPFAAGKGPSAAVIDPAGKFLFIANRVSGDVSVFAIDGPNETLHEVSGSPFPAGKGPAAAATDVTGSYLFVANHESNTISTFRIDSETGALTLLNQTPLTVHGPTALAADPSGRYLFVGNDTTGGILNLALDVATGTLAPAGMTAGPGKVSAIVLTASGEAQAP